MQSVLDLLFAEAISRCPPSDDRSAHSLGLPSKQGAMQQAASCGLFKPSLCLCCCGQELAGRKGEPEGALERPPKQQVAQDTRDVDELLSFIEADQNGKADARGTKPTGAAAAAAKPKRKRSKKKAGAGSPDPLGTFSGLTHGSMLLVQVMQGCPDTYCLSACKGSSQDGLQG